MSRLNLRRERGVTMIEVLIALLVLSIGLIGVAALQTSGVQATYLSYQYMQAANLTQSLAERMRGNRRGMVDSNSYFLVAGNEPPAPTVNCANASCGFNDQAKWDLAAWYSSINDEADYTTIPDAPKGTLPNAQASVACIDDPCTDDSIRMITIYWDATRQGADGYGCDASNEEDLTCFRLPVVP